VLGIDFDPQVIAAWRKQEHAAQYGDAEDPELAASLPLAHTRWVVCTAPRMETNLVLLCSLREFGYNGRVALTAHHAGDAETLRAEGTDLVLMPFIDAAKEAADVLLGEKVTATDNPLEISRSVEEEHNHHETL
jgi:Trk K+ transport system NAD-binding subunit